MSVRAAADATALLSRAFTRSAAAAGFRAEVADSRARPWSSATFIGERVVLTLRIEREAGAWLSSLAEADLPMRGWFVAGLIVEEAGSDPVVEALVLQEA